MATQTVTILPPVTYTYSFAFSISHEKIVTEKIASFLEEMRQSAVFSPKQLKAIETQAICLSSVDLAKEKGKSDGAEALYFLLKDAIRPAMIKNEQAADTLFAFKKKCKEILKELLPKDVLPKDFIRQLDGFMDEFEEVQDENQEVLEHAMKQEGRVDELGSRIQGKILLDFNRSQEHFKLCLAQKMQGTEEIDTQVDLLTEQVGRVVNQSAAASFRMEGLSQGLQEIEREEKEIKQSGLGLIKKV